MPSDNQQTTEAAQNESPFQQVIPNLSQQSLYPSLGAMGTTIKTSVSPLIPSSRRVINDIDKCQRRALNDSVKGTIRGTNTSPCPWLRGTSPGSYNPKYRITGQNHTSRDTRRNSATGVFRNTRHWH